MARNSLDVWCEDKNVFESEKFEEFSILFSNEKDHHLKTKALYSCLQSYLQQFNSVQEENCETDVFLDLILEIPTLCNKFLTIHSMAINQPYESQQPSNNLNDLSNNLESAGICFEIVLAYLKASCETKQFIVVKIALNILFQGYTHCKESEEIYGDQLEQFVNQLGNIFKKIENLQMIVLQKLDHLINMKDFEDSSCIKSIVLELGNLCNVASSLDADVAFQLWALYLRIIEDHHKHLDFSSDTDLALMCLVSKNIEILKICKFNLVKSSEEDVDICMKLNFYLDCLTKMLNIVPKIINEGITQLRMFLLTLFDFLISCYSPIILEKSALSAIKDTLTKKIFSLLSLLYTDEEFVISILLLVSEDAKPFQTALGLLKVCGLQYLKSSTLQCKIMKEVFLGFLSNTAEDDINLLSCNIPLCTVSKTDSEELVVLYQFVYEKISEFLKLIPDLDIRNLQNTFMDCLVSSSDAVFMLISDIWIYRLRCSNVEFLKGQCCSVLQNYFMEGINENNRIKIMLKRMLKYLPSSEKDKLSDQFRFLKCIIDEKEVLHMHSVADFTVIENELFADLDEKVQLLMSKLKEPLSNNVHHLVQRACACLELCALFVNFLGCIETYQLIELALDFFRSEVYEVQIATLTFIKALSRKSVPEHNPEFEKIVTCLAQLFSETIHSRNYIVRYEALNTFSYFAKCTPHVKIVQETVRRDPSLKLAIKSFITAVPSNGFLTEKEKTESLQMQILMPNHDKFETLEQSIQTLQTVISKFTCSQI